MPGVIGTNPRGTDKKTQGSGAKFIEILVRAADRFFIFRRIDRPYNTNQRFMEYISKKTTNRVGIAADGLYESPPSLKLHVDVEGTASMIEHYSSRKRGSAA